MPKNAITSSGQPPAVAYVRLADDEDADVLAGLLQDIAACCVREGLRLVRTFTDRGYDGTQLARPGIVELQEALKQTRGMAVVLPTLEHLSPADNIRRALVAMVRRLEGELIVATTETGTDSGGGVPGAGQR